MPDTRHAYEHVQGIYVPIAAGVFVFVLAALAVLLVRGARRRDAPGRRHRAPRFEIVYALVLACVVAVLVTITFRAEAPLDRTLARPSLRVGVTAAQWSWRFSYPGGASVAAVSTWRPPVALVPAGVEIEFFGTSRDVIHGFWIPRLDFQRQMLPGYTTRFDLRFDSPGRYDGVCSVFCGDQHTQMHFAIEAVSREHFAQWLTAHANSGGEAP